MSNELPTFKYNGQTIDYIGEIMVKKGVFKNVVQTSISGVATASQSTTDAHSTIKVKLANERHSLRKLMETFWIQPKNKDGQGSGVGMLIYPNNPSEPLIFEGGFLEDLPEIQEGNKGTAEYTFIFNTYSKTL